MNETLEMRLEGLGQLDPTKRSPMDCEHQRTRTVTHGIVKCLDCGLNVPPSQIRVTFAKCPVHGKYESTKIETCPTCLTQAALYRQIEMDGVEGITREGYVMAKCPVHGMYSVLKTPNEQQVCPKCEPDTGFDPDPAWGQAHIAMCEGASAAHKEFAPPGTEAHELGDCLDEAKRTICGERQDVYGSPEDSFAIIAEYWSTYLKNRVTDKDAPLDAKDIAHMMILFKMARVQGQAPSRDSYVDICGYAGIAADRLSKEK